MNKTTYKELVEKYGTPQYEWGHSVTDLWKCISEADNAQHYSDKGCPEG